MATLEHEHFMRCHTVVSQCGFEVVKGLLLQDVRTMLPVGSDPTAWTLDDYLQVNNYKIHKKLNPAKSDDQPKVRILFPGFGKKTDLSKWDLLLIILVLNATCESVSPYRKHLKELKKMRNDLCHQSKPVLSAKQFKKLLKQSKETINQLMNNIDDAQLFEKVTKMIKIFETGATTSLTVIKYLHEWCIKAIDVHKMLREMDGTLQNIGQGLHETNTKIQDLSDAAMKHHKESTTNQEEMLRLFKEHAERFKEHIEQQAATDGRTITAKNGHSIVIQIPDTKVIIEIHNCDDENELCEYLVDGFTNVIQNKEFDPRLQDKLQQAMREFVKSCLTSQYRLSNAKHECIALRFHCNTLSSFVSFWEDVKSGKLSGRLEPIEAAVRNRPGCEHFKMTISVDHEQFWSSANQIVKDLTTSVDLEPTDVFQQHGRHQRTVETTSTALIQPNERITLAFRTTECSEIPQCDEDLQRPFQRQSTNNNIDKLTKLLGQKFNAPKLQLKVFFEGSSKTMELGDSPYDDSSADEFQHISSDNGSEYSLNKPLAVEHNTLIGDCSLRATDTQIQGTTHAFTTTSRETMPQQDMNQTSGVGQNEMMSSIFQCKLKSQHAHSDNLRFDIDQVHEVPCFQAVKEIPETKTPQIIKREPIVDIKQYEHALEMDHSAKSDLQMKLRESFRKHVDHNYVTPKLRQLDYKTTKSTQLRQRILTFRDIFYNEGKQNRIIYVLGEAGSGKTSLCHHLMSLWLKGFTDVTNTQPNSDICESQTTGNTDTGLWNNIKLMKGFDFVFFVPLIHDSSTLSCVDEMIIKKTKSSLGLKSSQLIKNVLMSEKCLILLDGLDEWAFRDDQLDTLGIYEHRAFSNSIPYATPREKTTILTTSRPWKLTEVRIKHFELPSLICLEGLDHHENMVNSSIKLLNERFACTKTTEAFLMLTKKYHVCEFLSTPIVLLQLLFLWYNGQFGKSRCEIYYKMIDMFLSRPTFKTSGLTTSMKECLLGALGDLAFSGTRTLPGHLTTAFADTHVNKYLSNEERQLALTVGLLSKSESIPFGNSRSPRSVIYNFVHKTFQEFLAAVYIATTSHQVFPMINILDAKSLSKDASDIFVFVCGVNPKAARAVSSLLMLKLGEILLSPELLFNVQHLVTNGYKEALSNGHKDIELELRHIFVPGLSNILPNCDILSELCLMDINRHAIQTIELHNATKDKLTTTLLINPSRSLSSLKISGLDLDDLALNLSHCNNITSVHLSKLRLKSLHLNIRCLEQLVLCHVSLAQKPDLCLTDSVELKRLEICSLPYLLSDVRWFPPQLSHIVLHNVSVRALLDLPEAIEHVDLWYVQICESMIHKYLERIAQAKHSVYFAFRNIAEPCNVLRKHVSGDYMFKEVACARDSDIFIQRGTSKSVNKIITIKQVAARGRCCY